MATSVMKRFQHEKSEKNIFEADRVIIGGRDVRGVDAEAYRKLEAKRDRLLEKEICDWISKVTGETLDLEDPIESLRSGVILCKLANAIIPGIISKIHDTPIPMMEMENIRFYLEAAKKLGVPDIENFTVSDLYRRKGEAQVFISLSSIARKALESPLFKGPYPEFAVVAFRNDRNKQFRLERSSSFSRVAKMKRQQTEDLAEMRRRRRAAREKLLAEEKRKAEEKKYKEDEALWMKRLNVEDVIKKNRRNNANIVELKKSTATYKARVAELEELLNTTRSALNEAQQTRETQVTALKEELSHWRKEYHALEDELKSAQQAHADEENAEITRLRKAVNKLEYQLIEESEQEISWSSYVIPATLSLLGGLALGGLAVFGYYTYLDGDN